MKKLFLLTVLPGLLFAHELVFNGGFEIGTDGFAVVRHLEPEVNKKLTYYPLAVDAKNAASGKQSLKIANPNGEFFELHSKGFELKPNTEYTVSLKAKSDAPGAKIRVIVYNVNIKTGKWIVKARLFNLTNEYKTYSFDFNTGKDASAVWHIQIPPGKHYEESVPKGNTWMDDLSLVEKGKSSVSGVEATVASKRLYEKESGKADLTLKVYNTGKTAIKRALTVRGVDEYTGKELFKKKFDVALNAGEAKSVPFKADLEKYGTVLLKIDGADNVFDGHYAVIGKYTVKPLDLMNDYCAGLCGGVHYNMTPKVARNAYIVNNQSFESEPETLSRLGIRLMREHDGGTASTQWSALEPEQGKLDYAHMDRVFNIYNKYGIYQMPVLGRVEFVLPHEGWNVFDAQSEWLRKLSKRQEPVMPSWNKGNIILPPMELWKKYVYAVASHMKGKIPVYEIMNEPNFHLWPKNYVAYLKAASEMIRKADPNAKIAAFHVSSDFNSSFANWIAEAIKLGGFNDFDIGGFHPYGNATLSSPTSADDGITYVKKTFGKKPIWNSELYYTSDDVPANPDFNWKSRPEPYNIAWRFLLDLGEGVVQAPFLNMNAIYKPHLISGFTSGGTIDNYISGVGVMFNTLARNFEGAKPVLKRKFTQGVILYGYEQKNGKRIAAIWNFQKRKDLSANFAGMDVLDMFGNPVKAGTLKLGVEPYYLLQGKLSKDAFMKKLNEITILVDNPVQITPFLRIFKKNGEATAVLEIKNEGTEKLKGFIGITGAVSSKKMTKFELAPGKTAYMSIPVKYNADKKETEVRVACNKRIYRVKVKISENVSVKAGTAMKVGKGSCKVFEKDGKLAVSGFIPDVTDAGASGKRKPWETDCAELFFDLAPHIAGTHPDRYTDMTFRAFITPRDAEGKQLAVWSKSIKKEDCKLAVRKADGGWTFELILPVKASTIGFEIISSDSGKRTGSWAESKKAFADRQEFGIVEF